MRAFTVTEMQRMGDTQESAMMDSCVLMQWTETTDELNQMVPTWPDGPILTCGLDMTGGVEFRGRGMIMETWEARIRLPLGTAFDMRDRLRAVTVFGQPAQSTTVYEFDGPAQEGPSGIVVPLKAVKPRIE